MNIGNITSDNFSLDINGLQMQIEVYEKEISRLNNIINETRRILGEYKHYSAPDEIQNMFNEEVVDKAYIKLHENLKELKEENK